MARGGRRCAISRYLTGGGSDATTLRETAGWKHAADWNQPLPRFISGVQRGMRLHWKMRCGVTQYHALS